MALIDCQFFSETLGMATEATVILPQATSGQVGMDGVVREGGHPTLYLLHGMSDDHSTWTRRTSIERYAAPLGLAVVMPSVHRSWYTDQEYGLRYWSYLVDELPEIMRGFFPLSERREDTFAAGLSMGGYGAFKWALQRPDSLAAAASLSGGLDIMRWHGEFPEWEHTFGSPEAVAKRGDDLFALAQQVGQDACPPLFQWCGTEDYLFEDNARFRDRAIASGLPLEWHESSGSHEWSSWDAMIQQVLNWLPLQPQSVPE